MSTHINDTSIKSLSECDDTSSSLSLLSSSMKIFDIKKYNFLKKKRQEIDCKSQPWNKEEDSILLENKFSYADLSWQLISEKLKNRSAQQCMYRWTMNLEPSIKKGKWSKEEDEILHTKVNELGKTWSSLKQYLPGRTTKQIRERYINYISLPSNTKEDNCCKWNDEKDKLLLEYYVIYNASWVKICKMIPGTSENSVKNRFYSLLRQFVNKVKKSNVNGDVKDKITRLSGSGNGSGSGCGGNKGNSCSFTLNDFDFYEECTSMSYKEMILNNNPYITYGKSQKKNYSLKILIEFLPDLLEEKGININKLYTRKQQTQIQSQSVGIDEHELNNNNSNNHSNSNKQQAIKKIVEILSNHITPPPSSPPQMNNNNNVTTTTTITTTTPSTTVEQPKTVSSFKTKTKSSILFNMQLGQLGLLFDKLKNSLIHKYFKCLKEKTFKHVQ